MTTAATFANWAEKAARLTFSGLLFNIRDCREAAEAARSMGDAAGEGKYMDEMSAYLQEMESRKVIGRPERWAA